MFKQIICVIYLVLGVINGIQVYQIAVGIYPMGSPSKEIYWDNFLNLTRRYKVYDKVNWQLNESVNVSFTSDSKQIVKGVTKNSNKSFVLQVNAIEIYSPTFRVQFIKPSKSIVIRFNALAYSEIKESRLILYADGYESEQKIVYFNGHFQVGKTVELEYLVEFTEPIQNVEGYIWNGGTVEKLECFDMVVESYQK